MARPALLLTYTISPGASIGQLNVTGNVIMATGSTMAIELGAGTSSDLLAITGNLDLTAANDTLSLSGMTTGGAWTIATYSGNLVSGAHFDNISGMPSGYTIDYGTGSNSQIKIVQAATPGDFNGDGKVDAAETGSRSVRLGFSRAVMLLARGQGGDEQRAACKNDESCQRQLLTPNA